jgi:hypothetical protein
MDETTEVAAISEATLPYDEDSKKTKYLSYRLMNFTIRESLTLSNVCQRSRATWLATVPLFKELDGEGLTPNRKKLAAEYLSIEFTRNFRMVLEKDFQVLYKSLTEKILSKDDHDYLLKLRAHYTPQHLAMIKSLMSDSADPNVKPFDFGRFVVEIKEERKSITVTGG